MSWWNRKPKQATEPVAISSVFSTGLMPTGSPFATAQRAFSNTFQAKPPASSIVGAAMDSSGTSLSHNGMMYNIVSEAQLGFFGAQGFLGYNILAMLAQHWLIDKACTMPALDATRKGFELTANDGQEITPEVFAAINDASERFALQKNMVEFVRMGRVFGVRVAMFLVDGIDYEKPFNIDGVKPKSYRGMSQIDPYWMTPEFTNMDISDPSSKDFYEPMWWNVSGRRIHKSHLVVYNASPVCDLLKPTYLYGGISVTQKIYERVYAAERTANEAPQLAMTKRMNVLKTNVSQALANQGEFEAEMLRWTQLRDNYGVKVIGQDDTLEQHDTNLTGLDETIMTQYQIVAAASGVPATKLMGTTPKGFNSTGEFEESSYHEELETIQSLIMPLVNRHHELVIRSEIPSEKSLKVSILWESLDTHTAKEAAEINEIQARTDVSLVGAGAITGAEVLERIIKDKHSGYNGLEIEAPQLDSGEGLEDDAL